MTDNNNNGNNNILRRSIASLIAQAQAKKPLVCLTAYHHYIAHLLDPYVDVLLVGDSLGMVLYGADNTLEVSLQTMINHTKAVMRSTRQSVVMVDMPYGSYERDKVLALDNARRIMDEGAQGVKLEGGVVMKETIAYLVAHKIPVMAHIGLTPQTADKFGGYKAQGLYREEWDAIEADAQAVQEAGAFSVVLEAVSEPLADKITKALDIPTIGIGASVACCGQILVLDDMLGLSCPKKLPRFVKRFAELDKQIIKAGKEYMRQVRQRQFPTQNHIYHLKEGQKKK